MYDKNELKTRRKRWDQKRRALGAVLDSGKRSKHFWDAMLIEDIDILIRAVEDLGWNDDTSAEAANAINAASKSAERLSRRIFWLNIILVAVGIAGVIIAGYGIFIK
jgi:hypothetical protein